MIPDCERIKQERPKRALAGEEKQSTASALADVPNAQTPGSRHGSHVCAEKLWKTPKVLAADGDLVGLKAPSAQPYRRAVDRAESTMESKS